jgi:hypothetical protein
MIAGKICVDEAGVEYFTSAESATKSIDSAEVKGKNNDYRQGKRN